VFGSERLPAALLYSLTHHVHILEVKGDSYRLNQSKRRSRRSTQNCALVVGMSAAEWSSDGKTA